MSGGVDWCSGRKTSAIALMSEMKCSKHDRLAIQKGSVDFQSVGRCAVLQNKLKLWWYGYEGGWVGGWV